MLQNKKSVKNKRQDESGIRKIYKNRMKLTISTTWVNAGTKEKKQRIRKEKQNKLIDKKRTRYDRTMKYEKQ